MRLDENSDHSAALFCCQNESRLSADFAHKRVVEKPRFCVVLSVACRTALDRFFRLTNPEKHRNFRFQYCLFFRCFRLCKTGTEPVALSIKWHMEQLGSFLFGHFSTPVVACSGRDIRVPGHLLHRANISTRIEQVGDKGASEIVR
jgi:hypothetical protein